LADFNIIEEAKDKELDEAYNEDLVGSVSLQTLEKNTKKKKRKNNNYRKNRNSNRNNNNNNQNKNSDNKK
jgi:hypothetical protein